MRGMRRKAGEKNGENENREERGAFKMTEAVDDSFTQLHDL